MANGSGFIERGASVVPVFVKGLTAPDGLAIYKIKEKIVSGIPELSSDSALLGRGIADRLTLAVGDKFYLRNNRGDQMFLRVGGIFDLGAAAGNELVVVSMDMVRSFFAIEGVSVIEVQVQDVFAAEAIAREYGRQYERVKLESWQEKNRELLTALSSQSSSSGHHPVLRHRQHLPGHRQRPGHRRRAKAEAAGHTEGHGHDQPQRFQDLHHPGLLAGRRRLRPGRWPSAC